MDGIIIAEENQKEAVQREKDEREDAAGLVAMEFAAKWSKREELDKELRGSAIQITLECPQMEGLLLNNLIKENIKLFDWNENEFNIETSYSREEGVLNVVIDLIEI